MENHIAQLAARIQSAATEQEVRAVDLEVYHLRQALKERHQQTRDALLMQIAVLEPV